MTLTELEQTGEYAQMLVILENNCLSLQKGNYKAVVLHTNQDEELIINLHRNGTIVYHKSVSIAVFKLAKDLEAFINAITSK